MRASEKETKTQDLGENCRLLQQWIPNCLYSKLRPKLIEDVVADTDVLVENVIYITLNQLKVQNAPNMVGVCAMKSPNAVGLCLRC